MTGFKRAVVTAAIGVMFVGAAACSSSGTSTTRTASSATAGNTASAGVADARAKVAALRKPPGPLSIPTLPSAPPTGRSAYWISCKIPECNAADAGIQQGTSALGWTLHTLKPDLTPESFAAAWTQAVGAKPDVIFAVDLVPDSVIQTQLQQAQQNGTEVIMTSGASKVGENGVDATIASAPWYDAAGDAEVDWAIADSDGKAHIAILYDPSFPLQVAPFDAARAEAQRLCPDCTVDGVTIQTAQAGKDVPNQVISYLQRNPGVNYVVTTVSTNALGVGPAIKAAGLHVKLGTSNSQTQNLQAVKQGIEAFAIPNEQSALTWRMVDAAARLASGETLPAAIANPTGSRQLFDSTNIDSADLTQTWDVPDVRQTFLTAWHRT
jgi:hypothetical protein